MYTLREYAQELKRTDAAMNNEMIEKVFTLELSEEEKDNVLNFILRGKDFAQLYSREVQQLDASSDQSYQKFKEAILGAMRDHEEDELEMADDYVAVQEVNNVPAVHPIVPRATEVFKGICDEPCQG